MTKGPWFPLLFTMQWWMSVKIPSNSFQGNKVINFTKEIGSRVFCWFQNCFHERFLSLILSLSSNAAPKTCSFIHGTFLRKKKKICEVRIKGTKFNCTCKFEIKHIAYYIAIISYLFAMRLNTWVNCTMYIIGVLMSVILLLNKKL